MADEDPGSGPSGLQVTPGKRKTREPLRGQLTPQSKKWKSLDFSGHGGTARSTLGSSPNQKVMLKMLLYCPTL